MSLFATVFARKLTFTYLNVGPGGMRGMGMGILHIEILEPGEVMNSDLYAELVEDKSEQWAGNCEHLVCDFERRIRSCSQQDWPQACGWIPTALSGFQCY